MSTEYRGCEDCEKQRKMFSNGVKFLFEKCKFIQNMSPILLDSDNIKTDDDTTADKCKVMKALFKLLQFLIDEDTPENEIKVILEHMY